MRGLWNTPPLVSGVSCPAVCLPAKSLSPYLSAMARELRDMGVARWRTGLVSDNRTEAEDGESIGRDVDAVGESEAADGGEEGCGSDARGGEGTSVE